MKLTKLEEQGMRLSMCLSREGRQMTLPELAEREGLSEALVAKVLGKLRSGGIVRALRGRNGGYELAADPESLSVSVVLRSLGRPLIDGCFAGNSGQRRGPCPHAEDCGIRPVWEMVEDQVSRVLERITLADLVRREIEIRRQLASIGKERSHSKGKEPILIARSVCARQASGN
ncbi:MAG: Rrf2 family transcriptional regulator [Polyangia bacterium]